MEARLAARPEILKQRRKIAEHPFGSIKQWMNQGTFLLRGLEKVRAEFSLTALAYNFIRVATNNEGNLWPFSRAPLCRETPVVSKTTQTVWKRFGEWHLTVIRSRRAVAISGRSHDRPPAPRGCKVYPRGRGQGLRNTGVKRPALVAGSKSRFIESMG